jgi:hypothetical protein
MNYEWNFPLYEVEKVAELYYLRKKIEQQSAMLSKMMQQLETTPKINSPEDSTHRGSF